jgi:hypothetical protein
VCNTGLKTTGPGWNALQSWSCSKAVFKPVWHTPVPSVQWINSWWWAEELLETCRVSYPSKFWKLVHPVSFIMKKLMNNLKLWQIRKTLCTKSTTWILILIIMVNYLKSGVLTPQWRPQYPILTFSSSHAAGLGTLYGRGCLNFTVNIKSLPPPQLKFRDQRHWRVHIVA